MMLSFCLVGAMFNIKHKISVSTILLKTEFYRFIDISHSNMYRYFYIVDISAATLLSFAPSVDLAFYGSGII
jgi:hypothetical protein